MILVVAGSRHFGARRSPEEDFICRKLDELTRLLDKNFLEVVQGGCKGVDMIAQDWAWRNKCTYTTFHPNWERYGKAAGPKRNQEMAEYAGKFRGSVLVAFWDGESKGTADMIEQAELYGIQVRIIQIPKKGD